MQHPLIPSESKPKEVKAKELVLTGPGAICLETLCVLLAIVASPVLALVIFGLGAYKSTVGFMRTTLRLW